MSRLWRCDWCGAVWADRSALALLDVQYEGSTEEKVHACPEHLPEGWFPAADAQPVPDIDPVITAETWDELMSE